MENEETRKQESGLPSRPLISSTARGDNAERQLLQKIYDNLTVIANQEKFEVGFYLDYKTRRELEKYLYPEEYAG